MKRLLLLLLIAAACRQNEPAPATTTTTTTTTTTAPVTTSTAPPASTTTTASDESPLDPTGAYFAMDEWPAEFAELEHLSLATIDDNAEPAPLNGFLRPKAREAKDYALVNPKIEGQELTFTTAAVNGIHYEFAGTFAMRGNFAADPPSSDLAVLTGTLTKLRKGRVVASTPVRFHYEAGG
jgi:hypothetical protein